MDTNVLYYGDNHILRRYIPDDSVDAYATETTP